MFKQSYEADANLEKTEDSTLRGDDDTAQTLSFEIPQDNLSLSPTQSTANEDVYSTSAPVFIPEKNENGVHTRNISPIQNSTEYEQENPFRSYSMTQSLRTNESLTLPRPVQRATSTGPRLEHPDDQVTQYPSIEDPYFPFLNPDLGPDMKNTENQFRNSNPTTMNEETKETQSATNIFQKKKYRIVKGLSEANIDNHWNNQEPANNSITVLNSSELLPHKKLQGKQKFAASVKLPKSGSKRLTRKSSISSNLSFVGNYIFGSNIFQSPARSSTSMASDKINFVADAAGMFPSLMSLNSFDVAIDDDTVLPTSSSKPRSVSAFNSRQNSGNDLQDLDKKRSFLRSNSRGSSSSLSTRIFRDNDDKVVKDDEEADKLMEVKSVVSRTQPPKKQWQQTMPDLEEGPESDTLTVQSTIRNNLAAAALAISLKKGETDDKMAEKVITPGTYTKNLLILCFSYFFIFASYMSLRNIQSSLNNAGGLGMISLSCVYASIFFSSIFTTTIVQKLRPKLSIMVSFCGLCLYNISNFYPCYATLVPGSMIAGLSMAITWTGQGTYLANNAISSAKISGKPFSQILSFYQGIFFSSFQLSQVVGGLISSFIFSLQSNNVENIAYGNISGDSSAALLAFSFNQSLGTTQATTISPILNLNFTTDSIFIEDFTNSTQLVTLSSHHSCGMQYCPQDKSSKLNVHLDRWLYYLMVSVFLGSMLTGLLVLAFCLNPLEGTLKKSNLGVKHQILSVFRMATKPTMICLIPLMSYSILQTTFMFGEFNKAHVTCILGIHMIGFMTVFLSLCSSFFAFLSGNLQRHFGTATIIITGLTCHLLILISLWFWTPSKDSIVPFFVIVSLWGSGDGMIMAQLVSLLGTLFMCQKEAAFSAYKMVQSSSAFLMFITGAYVCTRVKAVILTVMVILAIVGCMVLKVRLRIEKSMNKSNKPTLSILNVSAYDPAQK